MAETASTSENFPQNKEVDHLSAGPLHHTNNEIKNSIKPAEEFR